MMNLMIRTKTKFIDKTYPNNENRLEKKLVNRVDAKHMNAYFG